MKKLKEYCYKDEIDVLLDVMFQKYYNKKNAVLELAL
jgi:hypothetical protein